MLEAIKGELCCCTLYYPLGAPAGTRACNCQLCHIQVGSRRSTSLVMLWRVECWSRSKPSSVGADCTVHLGHQLELGLGTVIAAMTPWQCRRLNTASRVRSALVFGPATYACIASALQRKIFVLTASFAHALIPTHPTFAAACASLKTLTSL
jgi:hypothetical protein